MKAISAIISVMNTLAQLQQQIAEFKTLLIQKDLEIAQKEARITYLYEQFILARQKQFGPSAERFAPNISTPLAWASPQRRSISRLHPSRLLYSALCTPEAI